MEMVKKIHSGNEFIHKNIVFLDSADPVKYIGTHGK